MTGGYDNLDNGSGSLHNISSCGNPDHRPWCPPQCRVWIALSFIRNGNKPDVILSNMKNLKKLRYTQNEHFRYNLFMYYAVIEFRELCLVPTVGCTDKVTGDALQFVKMLAAALWTLLKILCRVLVTAVEATVAVMVD